jgi:hypothetical protein
VGHFLPASAGPARFYPAPRATDGRSTENPESQFPDYLGLKVSAEHHPGVFRIESVRAGRCPAIRHLLFLQRAQNASVAFCRAIPEARKPVVFRHARKSAAANTQSIIAVREQYPSKER